MTEIAHTPRSSEVAAAAAGEKEVVVRALLMPFNNYNVLMPSTAIAEVVAYEKPVAAAQGPAWLKGFYSWRGRSVPVIDYEKIQGLPQAAAVAHQARLIIFNALGDSGTLSFLAMVAQGIPRLMVLKEANLHHLPGEQKLALGVYAHLLVDGNPAVVPDLELLEKMLIQAGVRDGK